MAELFPTRIRGSGLSISYAFAVAIFGGFAPFIHEWLISTTGSPLALSYYMMFAAVAGLLALIGARSLGHR
jgi:MHS family proline/betaine transporter-like MFS transporter